MKQIADRGQREVTFQEGDLIFLKMQSYRQQSTFRRAHQKLASKYYGPYPIEERVRIVAYKLKLPDSVRLHPVFHVSLLRKKLRDGFMISSELPPLSDEGTLVIELEAILDTRWVKCEAKFSEESLVKWHMLVEEDATWESTKELL